MNQIPGPPSRELADIASSSDDYARRFAGPVGDYLLLLQARATRELLAPYPGASVLEVGGGHAQLTGRLLAAGHRVVVQGSAPACRARLLRLPGGPEVGFVASDLLRLPFADRAFDLVLAYRLLAHVVRWPEFLAELCRVARRAVVVDYAELCSVNLVAQRFFKAKLALEKNTRPFACFRRAELLGALAARGFGRPAARPQCFWPLALHRGLKRPGLSRLLEGAAAGLGLTRLLGSPVVLRVERLDPTPND